MGLSGTQAWSPYLVSLVVDVTSHWLHGSLVTMPEDHRREMVKRRFALLLYLIRSPFYDRKSKQIILKTLQFSRDNIPLVGIAAKAVMSYLDDYQEMYFYSWAS